VPDSLLNRRAWLRSTVGLGALGVGMGLGLRPRRAMASASGPEKVLESAKSEYNEIHVTESGPIRTMYFVVDGMRYIESRWDMSHPQSLDLDYSRTMMAGFMLNPEPRRLMMMGLGGGQITNYLFERFPNLEIDAVDIDPEVVRLAQAYFGVPKDDPRYRIHVGDGRVFIEKGERPWDMIMLDAFRGVFVPYHLKTREFYEACRRQLTESGVVVANLHNMTRMYPYDRTTLGATFPQQYAFVSEAGNQTTFVASAKSSRVGAYAMRRNARKVQGKFDFDVMGLAARHYMHADWDEGLRILEDDFKGEELEGAAARHNTTCIRGCAYPTR
jgi:spermidine synthase